MQAAVHQMPQMLPQYPRQSFNGVVNGAHVVPPTPPVATRKRKRPHQYTVSYSEVQEVDSEGKLREVIVIDDTPPPPTISPATTYTNGFSASYQPPQYSAPIRTRARAAAEAQALSASTSSVAIIPPAPKKRKRDPVDDPRATVTKKTVTTGQQQQPVTTTKSWASGSGAATDDVCISDFSRGLNPNVANFRLLQASKGPVPCDDKEGHYIIVPDDLIARRCAYKVAELVRCGS
jgi:dual-specificity kinase